VIAKPKGYPTGSRQDPAVPVDFDPRRYPYRDSPGPGCSVRLLPPELGRAQLVARVADHGSTGASFPAASCVQPDKSTYIEPDGTINLARLRQKRSSRPLCRQAPGGVSTCQGRPDVVRRVQPRRIEQRLKNGEVHHAQQRCATSACQRRLKLHTLRRVRIARAGANSRRLRLQRPIDLIAVCGVPDRPGVRREGGSEPA
jgi:hypothetical protein